MASCYKQGSRRTENIFLKKLLNEILFSHFHLCFFLLCVCFPATGKMLKGMPQDGGPREEGYQVRRREVSTGKEVDEEEQVSKRGKRTWITGKPTLSRNALHTFNADQSPLDLS